MATDPLDIINALYPPETGAHAILTSHCRAVAERALEVAGRYGKLHPDLPFPDMQFIEEAALLHDIGIYLTHAPAIGCHGPHPYVCHGVLGRAVLEERGLFRHALVCERHVGVGLTAREIREQQLPLPERDMRPQSLEEKIICYADKFFSKKWQQHSRALPLESVVKNLRHYGEDKVSRFLEWQAHFEENGESRLLNAEAAS